VSLALVTIELETRKNEEEKQSKRKSSNEHKYFSLTSHYLIGIVFGLRRGFDLLFVSCIECYHQNQLGKGVSLFPFQQIPPENTGAPHLEAQKAEGRDECKRSEA
jgi:hypothetical protein